MKWIIDMDGVITGNPQFFKWWTYHLNRNDHEVIILTTRNPTRRNETIHELKFWGIAYHQLVMMTPEMPRDFRTQAEWKVGQVNKIKPDIWIDDQLKIYERELGIDLSKVNKRVSMLRI